MNHRTTAFSFRSLVVVLLVILLSGCFLWLSYDAIVNQALDQSELNQINFTTSTETIPAARGSITDRYGRTLVTDKTEYSVTLDLDAMGDEHDQAQVIQRLIALCKEQGIGWNDEEFPVSDSVPYEFTTDTPYQYTDEDGEAQTTRLGQLMNQMQKDGAGWGNFTTSASQLVRRMRSYYGLDEGYSETEAREIIGVLYSCRLRSGSGDNRILWTDYYFVEDVEIDFISVVKEEGLQGVSIEASAVREYETDYAAVLLGQVGAISEEKWAELQEDPDNSYNMNDRIGLSGMESAFEQYLKGTDGTLVTTYDGEGTVLSEEYTTAPEAGYTVNTTLDIDLQKATEDALNELTDQINGGAGGSAAVVIDVKSGEVLAAASYPTYSAKTYLEDYEELSEDSRTPLYNRAFLGTYAPGSTYKICTATAISNYGIASVSDAVNCTGEMKYGNVIFHCWQRSGHGSETMEDAIRDSCNIYFYTLGEQVGIEAETETAQAYGLGTSTGIELTESTGVNAGPEYSETVGATWYPGNVLSASIGQSDNQFTPLQLANYIATFANGGTHYRAHLLKSVKTSDNSSIVCDYADTVEDPVLNTVPLSADAQKAIKQGMSEVIEADSITDFEELEARGVTVCCKTGTAQIGDTGLYNGLFVSFAPMEDPEIAICTVVEKASSGASTAAITAAIMDYYFSDTTTLERIERENALLR